MNLNKIPEGAKTSLRSQLNQVYKSCGVMPEQLKNPTEFPDGFQYIWNFFIELSNFSARINFTELRAWSELYGHDLLPIEVGLIMRLEAVKIEVFQK